MTGAEASASLCHHRIEPVGVDLCESFGWFYLWIAFKDAGAVLVDIPSDVDSKPFVFSGVIDIFERFNDYNTKKHIT